LEPSPFPKKRLSKINTKRLSLRFDQGYRQIRKKDPIKMYRYGVAECPSHGIFTPIGRICLIYGIESPTKNSSMTYYTTDEKQMGSKHYFRAREQVFFLLIPQKWRERRG
jgi:hypothetical protein